MAEEKYLKDLDFCKPPDTCLLDGCAGFYGCCAYPCVQGLMLQKLERDSVAKADAGTLKCCYVEACYPCVITDSCVAVCCFNSATSVVGGQSQFGRALSQTAQTGIQAGIRTKLINKANPGSTSMTASWIQVCLPCYFVPCNDAAYVIAIKEESTKNTEIAVSVVGGLLF